MDGWTGRCACIVRQRIVLQTAPSQLSSERSYSTGTSSIFCFFECSGLKSMHCYCCGDQVDPQKGGPNHMASCMLKNLQRVLPKSCTNNVGTMTYLPSSMGLANESTTKVASLGLFSMTVPCLYNFEGPCNRLFFPQHHYQRTASTISKCDLLF
jgi:hypothetical protein